jgi:hypothetical protein
MSEQETSTEAQPRGRSKMTLEELEAGYAVKLSLNASGEIDAEGDDDAIEKVLARTEGHRAEVKALLRERQGPVIVKRELPPDVPSLAEHRVEYENWLCSKGKYYQPTRDEMDTMFSVLEEGDQVLPDFAHSFTVRRKNGKLIQVDRRGRISAPSPYRIET